MPARLKIRIMASRNLPIMDKSSDTSDAFVEVKIGQFTGKTEVFRHSLNPVWNSEWFKFEVPDEELQDECLQIKVMDYDRYSADDQIGKVYLNLNPLLFKECGHMLFGFYPIYDTMHGCRGEIFCIIKIEKFSDSNKFRSSSCGIRFFHSPNVPYGYYCTQILGFVEELVVNEDPEYQFIEKFRTSRASNEARQTTFYKLSAEVQRKLGSKALELGGNAVLGYQLYYDMENSSIVVRGIGTSVILKKIVKKIDVTNNQVSRQQTTSTSTTNPNDTSVAANNHQPQTLVQRSISNNSESNDENDIILAHPITNNDDNKNSNNLTATPASKNDNISSPIKVTTMNAHQRHSSSDYELNSPTSKQQQQLQGSVGSNIFGNFNLDDLNATNTPAYMFVTGLPGGFHLLEYPFITMKQFPIGLIKHIGGVVSSRSVKHLDMLNSQDDSESESRDAWWMELRKEVRNHCRMLSCNSVLGYTETCTIHDDVCILSASGTAAVLHTKGHPDPTLPAPQIELSINSPNSLTNSQKFDLDKNDPSPTSNAPPLQPSPMPQQPTAGAKTSNETAKANCTICHIPYGEKKSIFGSALSKCMVCKKGYVPDVIFSTIEPPINLCSIGTGCLIQARVFRNKKDTRARELSDSLPFLEYEIHKQLLTKLKMKNMNALFNLSVQLSVGDNLLIAVATGTGVFLSPLPEPRPIKVKGSSGKSVRTARLNDIQKGISDLVERNKERYGLKNLHTLTTTNNIDPSAQAKNMTTNQNNNSLQPNNNVQMRSNSLTKPDDHLLLKPVHNSSSEDDLLSPRSISSHGKQSSTSDQCVVLEVDDADDAEIVSLMIDSEVPKTFEICNTDQLPGNDGFLSIYQTFNKVFRAKITNTKQFSAQFDWIIQSLFVKLRRLTPCALVGLRFKVDAGMESDIVQISIIGTVVGIKHLNKSLLCKNGLSLYLPTHCYQDNKSRISNDEETFEETFEKIEIPASVKSVSELTNRGNVLCVELTTLSYIPKCKIVKYIGNLTFPFIREETSVRECGGLNGFLTSFLNEVNNIVRSHIVGLDGNALVSMNITQLVLLNNPHKNQAQCLIIINGDVVKVNYSKFFKQEGSQMESSPCEQ